MTCATNAGGMTVAQAMIKGTADATITSADVLSGKVGYGKDGARVVGTLVPPTKTMSGTIAGSKRELTVNWDAGFIPNYVALIIINWGGELKTPSAIRKRNSNGTWEEVGSADIHNYYDGSGGFDIGTIYSVNDKSVTFLGLENGYNYVWIAWQ